MGKRLSAWRFETRKTGQREYLKKDEGAGNVSSFVLKRMGLRNFYFTTKSRL